MTVRSSRTFLRAAGFSAAIHAFTLGLLWLGTRESAHLTRGRTDGGTEEWQVRWAARAHSNTGDRAVTDRDARAARGLENPGAVSESSAGAPAAGAPLAPTDPIWTQLRRRISERLEYPLALRRRGVQGRVELLLEIAENGELRAVSIRHSDAGSELAELAERAARAAAPFPETRGRGAIVVHLPVDFELRN